MLKLGVLTIVFNCLLLNLINGIKSDEIICSINGIKALHEVNEKFLGISIDPVVLLAGLNLSENSLKLAKHLGPAFIRIAGPSTKFVKYVDNEENKSVEHLLNDDASNVVVTPSMWFGINEWLSLANLTPVFGINDNDDTTNGVWNPKATLPLLEISDKFNVSCYWQLGYDCSNKTELQYKENLMIFRHVLDAFPERNSTWKIIGSDLTKCLDNDPIDSPRRVLDDLHTAITSVMWEPNLDGSETIFLDDPKIQTPPKHPIVKLWTMAPKNTHPVSFSSAILWAKEMGEAARIGYDVIFRQLRVHEIFTVTPAYWVSLLFNTLMGRNVLEVKANYPQNEQVSVYAHCTKKQNSFVRRGAITVMVINNATTNHTILLRLGNPYLKNTEVQSYILTAPNEQSTEVYLNDLKLGLKDTEEDDLIFTPKLRRAKILNYLSLSLPPKSIGFFVLPVARLPVCINNEEEMNLLMEEIQNDQNISFSDEVSINLDSRSNFRRTSSLKELRKLLEDELKSDERFYNQINRKPKQTTKKTDILHHNKQDYITKETRNFFIDMAKKHPLAFEHKKVEPKIEDVHRQYNLELTSGEIRRILTDRAKAKAAKKNVIFTSAELDELMKKATEKFLKNTHTTIMMTKAKRSTIKDKPRDKKDINMKLLQLKTLGDKGQLLKKMDKRLKESLTKKRNKRDINMDLLKLKTETLQHNSLKKKFKSHFQNNEEKTATLRSSDEESPEIFDGAIEEEDDDDTEIPNKEIFAELASAEEKPPTTENSIIKFLKPKGNIFKTNPFGKFSTTKRPFTGYKYKPSTTNTKLDYDDNIQIFTASDEFESNLDENFTPYIHEFYKTPSKTQPQLKVDLEMWEVIPEKKKTETKITNRNFGEDLDDNQELNRLLKIFNKSLKKEKETLESLDDDYPELDVNEKIRFKRDDKALEDRIFFNLASKKDESWREKQALMLKNRAAHKKKLDMINRYQKVKHHHRPSRSILDFDNFVGRNYESLTDNLVWKPMDILNLTKIPAINKVSNVVRQSTTLKTINDSPIFKIFVGQNNIQRHKRSTDADASKLSDNDVDAFMNEIVKEGTSTSVDNGDYQLIFPNKDKIELDAGEKPAILDIKFVPNTSKENVIQKIPPKSSNSEQKVWTRFIEDVKGFFARIGGKFISYLAL